MTDVNGLVVRHTAELDLKDETVPTEIQDCPKDIFVPRTPSVQEGEVSTNPGETGGTRDLCSKDPTVALIRRHLQDLKDRKHTVRRIGLKMHQTHPNPLRHLTKSQCSGS